MTGQTQKNVIDSTIDPLKTELKRQNIITDIQAREIEKLNTIKILCSHHRGRIPTSSEVNELINGTKKLILSFP